MMKLKLVTGNLVSPQEKHAFESSAAERLQTVDSNSYNSEMLGWVDVNRWAGGSLLAEVKVLAEEIRQNADVLVVVGLGGSNQGARAVIEALDHLSDRKVEVLYAGTTLSASHFHKIFRQIGNRSVYVNVIAKNFKTLEPGVAFRTMREYMAKRYSTEEAAKRIITTATFGDGELHSISQQNGYRCLPFPEDVGGRYSVFTPVGLLPIAAAGIDIDALLAGATAVQQDFLNEGSMKAAARQYALTRNLLLHKGYDIEVLSSFEPALEAVGKWWRQLFGESEGKNLTGIFPALCNYTEDLHSMGQYMQQGKRQIMETFLHVCKAPYNLDVSATGFEDGFEYLNGKNFAAINEHAYEATVKAHVDGGVPCFILELDELSPYTIGELLFFFMIACYYSAVIMEVDPFDQPGVENYKCEMFKLLKK